MHGVCTEFHSPSAVDRAKAPFEVDPSNLGRGSLPVPGLEGSCSVHCQPLRSAPELCHESSVMGLAQGAAALENPESGSSSWPPC